MRIMILNWQACPESDQGRGFPSWPDLHTNDKGVTWYILTSCMKALGWRNTNRNPTWRHPYSWSYVLGERASWVSKNPSNLLWCQRENIPDKLLIPVHTRRRWEVNLTQPASVSDTANFRVLHWHIPGSDQSQTWMNGGLRQPNTHPSCSVHKEWRERLTAPLLLLWNHSS